MKRVPTSAYAFAAELQAFADAHRVKLISIKAEARNEKRDFLSAFFFVPRPKEVVETTEKTPVEATVELDETTTAAQIDEPVGTVALETVISELEKELDHKTDAESVEKDEVNNNEI